MGRPPGGDSTRNVRFVVLLSQTEAQRVTAAAEAAEVTRGEYIRRTVLAQSN